MDVLLQVERLEPQHQIEEVCAVENSSQVKLHQASEITMITSAVFNKSQIVKDLRDINYKEGDHCQKNQEEMKDNPRSDVQYSMKKSVKGQIGVDKDIETVTHVTQWQELGKHASDIVSLRGLV